MDVKVLVLCVRSATAKKSGNPYYQAWIARWDESAQEFCRPCEQFIEAEEFQNLVKLVPCTAMTSNHFRVANGSQIVEFKGFIQVQPLPLPWTGKASPAAKAS